MAMFEMTDSTKIYILTPWQFGGGGGEALHQLAHKLKGMGKQVFTVYRDALHTPNKANGRPATFSMYDINETMAIEDRPENILITPEVWTQDIGRMFPRMQIAIWWLSVTNNANSGEGRFNAWGDTRIRHLAQSIYAQKFVHEHGRTADLLFDYLDLNTCIGDTYHKDDVVCYNPAKGLETTRDILNGLGVSSVALQGMTRKTLVETLGKSKIYIDFGHHPGMDRLPREAVLNKCIVIVGRNGSANTDIPIPEIYKFHNHEITQIRERITDCILDYGQRILDFRDYRQSQLALEQTYESQIRNIFQ